MYLLAQGQQLLRGKMTDIKNPFDEGNFVSGKGFGWDGKVVTIISAKTEVDTLRRGDGTPVLNDDGTPAVRNVLAIVGVAEGEERERRETYSAGNLRPTADGEGFLKADGTVGGFHASSEIAAFIRGAKGFDFSKLWDPTTGRQYFSKLVGAKFEFVGVDRKDKNGNPKKNSKGYVDQKFYPSQFVGTSAAAPASASSSEVRDRATELVKEILAAADGPLTKIDLVKAINKKYAGESGIHNVVATIASSEFLRSGPWTYGDAGLSL